MRKVLVTVLATVAALGIALPGVTGPAGASVRSKPPVKLDGTVTNKGTKPVKGNAVVIEQDDLYFKSTFLKAKAGSTIKVTVKNDGGTAHTFTIDGQGIDKTLSPGKTAKLDVTIPTNGKPVPFYCRFHVASGMQGAFFTKAGAAAKSSGSSDSSGDGGYGY